MNIYIVNHSVKNCGVYQYGKRVGSILTQNKGIFKYTYIECDTLDYFLERIKENPVAIIYNHLNGTMPWLTQSVVNDIRKKGIIQFLIVHNVGYETWFDYYLHQDPNHPEDERNFALLRPLPVFDIREENIKEGNLRIGSFGFGFRTKHFEDICKWVNDQIKDGSIKAVIHLHLTVSHFCPNQKDISSIFERCKSMIIKKNITLEISTDFWTDEELLRFLNSNDINIFFYEKYHSYNGISSSIDFALAARKPIAICRSNMFSHIWDSPICIEEHSLHEIIKNGIVTLQKYYDAWTHEKFQVKIQQILEKVLRVNMDTSEIREERLGFFYTCYKERRAVEFSIEQTFKFYPRSPVWLVSDGGIDFSYLKQIYLDKKLTTLLESDTMGATFSITDQNFIQEQHQIAIKNCAWTVLNRLEQFIFTHPQLKTIVMMDPDAFIRGKLNIPDDAKLLGSRVNHGFPQALNNVMLQIPGAICIDTWGCTPGIFNIDLFKTALQKLRDQPSIMDRWCQAFYAIYAHDVLLPLLFALKGYEETFNPDITECRRDPNWRSNGKPLVHQFREYY